MKTSKLILLSLLIGTLAACGGSTKRIVVQQPDPTPTPTPTPTPPPVVISTPEEFRTAEFNRSWGLSNIGAEHAYAAGYKGGGQIIGFVDFNFDFTSSEVNYHHLSAGIDAEMKAIYEAQIGDTAPDSVHGQAVAVVAAGIKNDIDTHGVAFDAQVLAVDYFSGVRTSTQVSGGATYYVSDPYSYLVDNGARVVSISIGYDEDDVITNPPAVGEKYVLQTAAIVIEKGGLLIAAAGNNGHPEPMVSNIDIRDRADEFNLLTNGPGAYLIVGSIDEDNVISSFSDRAGSQSDIFLVAPGERVVAPWTTVDDGDGLYYLNGTSFAAPHVAGAAAILFNRWPNLTAKQVAEILLTTATDLGDIGVDAIYGHGKLNLEEAIKPQGGVGISVLGVEKYVEPDEFSLIVGAPFGDARPIGVSNVMGLDKFNRDFYFDLSNGVHNMASANRPITQFMEQGRKTSFDHWQVGGKTFAMQVSQNFEADFLATQSQFVKDNLSQNSVMSGSAQGQITNNLFWNIGAGSGLKQSFSNLRQGVRLLSDMAGASYLSSTGASYGSIEHFVSESTSIKFGMDISSNDGFQYHINSLLREDLPRQAFSMQIDHVNGFGQYGFRLGQLIEQGAVLGSRSFGAFNVADGAVTSFAGVEVVLPLIDGVKVSSSFEAGVTKVNHSEQSFFESFNSFASSTWQVQLQAKDIGLKNSQFVLSAKQPLRVENATLTYHQAVGLDRVTAKPLYEEQTTAFSPSGREIAIEAAYVVSGNTWSVEASFMHRLDAGHAQGRQDTAGLLWLKKRF